MNNYRITSRKGGMDLGVYKGENEHGALDAMARDAGYADYAHAVGCHAAERYLVCKLVPLTVTNRYSANDKGSTPRPADWDERPNRRTEATRCPDCDLLVTGCCDSCGCCGYCGDCQCIA